MVLDLDPAGGAGVSVPPRVNQTPRLGVGIGCHTAQQVVAGSLLTGELCMYMTAAANYLALGALPGGGGLGLPSL